MAAKKGGLGKGLDSLINDKVNTKQLNSGIMEETPGKEPTATVKISLVEPNRDQPRKHFAEEGLEELADSIRQYGIIQPLIVQNKKDYYEIIAGERRWRAAKIAGLKEVPVIIRDISDQEIMEMSLIENIQREDLNPIEEARAYQRLLDEFQLKQEEVAKRVSKSRTAVTNSLRLLKLCEEVQQMVIDGKLTNGHARCLISLENPEVQLTVAKQVAEQNLSVRETEKLMKKLQKQQKKAVQENREEADETLKAIYENIAEQMKQILGTKVEIRQKNRDTGKIEIEYYSQDELDRILQMIRSIDH
ncbi:MAG: ParB/RepB/Spo0J family partition protein [Lachnospiraceae bacterium]|nr:ParB/RepB/Spo0J family partition protein [Lachnospiraceae bacterium]